MRLSFDNQNTAEFKSFASFLVLNLIFSTLFFITYIVVRRLNPDPVVYYSGIRIVLGCALAYLLVGFALRSWLKRSHRVISHLFLPSLFSFLLVGYSFVITIPSLLDRSISIYIISAVTQSGEQGISLDQIQDVFLKGYIDGTTTIEKRLNEQIISKDVALKDGRYFATNRGKFVYRTNIFLAKLFNIPDKYIIAINRPAALH